MIVEWGYSLHKGLSYTKILFIWKDPSGAWKGHSPHLSSYNQQEPPKTDTELLNRHKWCLEGSQSPLVILQPTTTS
eukprot:2872615-Amphidinium_carterae.1